MDTRHTHSTLQMSVDVYCRMWSVMWFENKMQITWIVCEYRFLDNIARSANKICFIEEEDVLGLDSGKIIRKRNDQRYSGKNVWHSGCAFYTEYDRSANKKFCNFTEQYPWHALGKHGAVSVAHPLCYTFFPEYLWSFLLLIIVYREGKPKQ